MGPQITPAAHSPATCSGHALVRGEVHAMQHNQHKLLTGLLVTNCLYVVYTPPSHPCLSHTAATFPQLITTTPCLTENHAVMCFPCSFSVILPLLVTCKFSECSDSSIFHAFWSEFQFWPWWGPGTSWSWGQNPTAVVSPAKTLFGLPGQQNPTSTLSSLSIFIPYPGPIQQDGNDNCTKISTEREPEVLWSLVHPWRQ